MTDLLKGNYDLEEKQKVKAQNQEKDASSEFEEKAMDRLGGSIAFVMKGKRLVWDEDEES